MTYQDYLTKNPTVKLEFIQDLIFPYYNFTNNIKTIRIPKYMETDFEKYKYFFLHELGHCKYSPNPYDIYTWAFKLTNDKRTAEKYLQIFTVLEDIRIDNNMKVELGYLESRYVNSSFFTKHYNLHNLCFLDLVNIKYKIPTIPFKFDGKYAPLFAKLDVVKDINTLKSIVVEMYSTPIFTKVPI